MCFIGIPDLIVTIFLLFSPYYLHQNIFYRGYLRNQAKHLLQRFMCDRKGIGLIGRQRRVQTDIHAIPFRQISGQFINRLFSKRKDSFAQRQEIETSVVFFSMLGTLFYTRLFRPDSGFSTHRDFQQRPTLTIG